MTERDRRGRFTRAPAKPLVEILADVESELRVVDHQLDALRAEAGARPDFLVTDTTTRVWIVPDEEPSVPTWLWCAFFFAAGWCVAMLVNLGWSR